MQGRKITSQQIRIFMQSKNIDGVTDTSMSLKQMMAACKDFRGQRTAMEDLTEKLHIEVLVVL